MNTYIKMGDAPHFAAVRATRTALVKARPDLTPLIAPATRQLRQRARAGDIPTLQMLDGGRLGYL